MPIQSLSSDSQELFSYFNPSSFIKHGANNFSEVKGPLSPPQQHLLSHPWAGHWPAGSRAPTLKNPDSQTTWGQGEVAGAI